MLTIPLQIPWQDFLNAIDLISSAVAASVAFFILWFTVMKGPDIDLLSRPEIEFDKESLYHIGYLDSISLKPIDLVFANNGSRGGTIVDVEAIFRPAEQFSKFFRRIRSSITVKSQVGANSQSNLPLPVPERGTVVVSMQLDLELKRWKDFSRLPELGGTLDEALKILWKDGQKSLKAYSKLKGDLGTLEISVRRTKRRLLKTQIRKDVMFTKQNVGPLPAWIAKDAHEFALRFRELRPPDSEVARDVRRILENFVNDFKGNEGTLATSLLQGNYERLRVSGWDHWIEMGRTYDIQYRFVLLREKDLLARLSDFYERAREYNLRMEAIPGETPTTDPEVQALETLRISLQQESPQLLEELTKFRSALVEATVHLLSTVPSPQN